MAVRLCSLWQQDGSGSSRHWSPERGTYRARSASNGRASRPWRSSLRNARRQPRSNRPMGSGLGGLLLRLCREEELSEEELDALVDEATIDAYGDDEQLGAFVVMIEDNLEMPF